MCFAGRGLLAPFGRAMDHLSVGKSFSRGLTVFLWDSISTHTESPRIPSLESSAIHLSGELISFNDERYSIVVQPAVKMVYALEKAGSRAFFWTHDAAKIPYQDRGAPLRLIFQRWLMEKNLFLIHAAAIGIDGAGVLLTGKGGSGKSTTALACLAAEMHYAGDDYCLIDTKHKLYVHSLYCSGKLPPETVHLLPSLEPTLSNKDSLDSEKALFFLNHHFPENVVPGFPVKAILIPRISGRDKTSLKEVSPAKGFMALAPTSVYQLHRSEQAKYLRALSSFGRQVPNFVLQLGSDVVEVANRIKAFLVETF